MSYKLCLSPNPSVPWYLHLLYSGSYVLSRIETILCVILQFPLFLSWCRHCSWPFLHPLFLVFSLCLSHLIWHIIAYGKAYRRVSYHHLSFLPQRQFYLSPKVKLSKYEEQKQRVTEQVDHVNKERTFDSDNFTLCVFCEDIYQPCLYQNLGQKYQSSIGIMAKEEQHRVMNNTLGRKNGRCLFLLY